MNKDDLAAYYFHQGTNYYAYNYLGCSIKNHNGIFEYTFRVWAPSADSVYFVSDATGWFEGEEMTRITEKGIYECVISSPLDLSGTAYKFRILRNGAEYLKGDPYARFSRGGDDGASVIYSSTYKWTDTKWMNRRKEGYLSKLNSPINVYEIHAGSFMRHPDGRYLSYRELADVLIPYIKYMGYTHVEFLPLMEHPYDASWGYQICAYFAPSARFGTPDDLKYLIDRFHNEHIGVILDFVPAHFPKDEWGLYEFDGTPVYEYQGKDRMESRSWGTRFFDLGREEVQSFLISAVMYYIREYHVDGLRFDAVASILYLDYDRNPDEWIKNSYGGKESLEGIAFLKKLNGAVQSETPDVLTVAEESGDIGNVTAPLELGGLGFDLKWNMGFSNDFFDYMSTDSIYRKYHHTALNFPIHYAFKERYMLPISHDEVVHGKRSFIDKMYGDYEAKFREMRCALLLIMTYPGKKLCFMGTEFAQFREWDHDSSLEWFMLDYEPHRAMREYVAALNRFYNERRALWEEDFKPSGFEWILPDESEKCSVAFKRFDRDGDFIITAINFSGDTQTLAVGREDITEVFNTGKKSVIHNGSVILEAYSGAILERKIKKFSIKEELI